MENVDINSAREDKVELLVNCFQQSNGDETQLAGLISSTLGPDFQADDLEPHADDSEDDFLNREKFRDRLMERIKNNAGETWRKKIEAESEKYLSTVDPNMDTKVNPESVALWHIIGESLSKLGSR